jgi:hypothetical protein
MGGWRGQLPVDPVPGLLGPADEALAYFVQRDLLDEQAGPAEALWQLPGALKLVRKQQADGSWRYPGKNRDIYVETNYDLLETFRSLGQLVGKYGFHRQHPAVWGAAEYILTCPAVEGDIRGILGTQYMPYYGDRKAPHCWTKFQYPFWWTNILTALDSLSLLGFSADDEQIQQALDWFRSGQQENGLWKTSYEQAKHREPRPKEVEAMSWVGLAVCRVFRRFYG